MAERVLLDLQRRDLAQQFGWPTLSTLTVQDICDLVIQDYQRNNRGSLRTALGHRKFWVHLCGGKLAETINNQLLIEWSNQWLKERIKPSTVNRRMCFLLRGYALAIVSDPSRVVKAPKWKRLKEDNIRKGFCEWEDFVQIRDALPAHAKCPVTIDYWTGMRPGETFGLEWTQVRFDHRKKVVFIQLCADTKNDEPRLVAMGGDLYDILWWWRQYTKQTFPLCPWVCHRNGDRLKSIKTSWKNACVQLSLGKFTKPDKKYATQKGYVGPILHDFRRGGVRNMVRSAVPDKIAMNISGHKTRSVFDRYNIINEADLIEAGRRIVKYHEERTTGQPGHGFDPEKTNE